MNYATIAQIAALERRVVTALGLVAVKNLRIVELENQVDELDITIGVLNARIVELEEESLEVHLAQQALRERGHML